ncbi:hypothetical protein [Pseudomonas lactis]|uniref:hypothetical protein n=1 Tax=Pseudomonas lactis TaxID=1615674 RepID=UPI001F3BAA12|nr:hypothetical protein [Pseudomonas lactis]
MSEFKREDRYIVIKRSDLGKVPAGYWSSLIEPIGALRAHLPHRECLVIESDWPEYEVVWQMIERRMTGQPAVTAAEELDAVLHWRGKHAQAIRERDALQQRLTAADERWDELVSAVRSINRSPHYMVKAIDDDQPQYRQRKEWIDWVLELCDAAPTSSERSNKVYAIEHAEYMAKSADDVMTKFQAYGLALLAVDEGGDDGEGELLENIDSARGDLQESLVELRSMVYEFRKRAAKSR